MDVYEQEEDGLWNRFKAGATLDHDASAESGDTGTQLRTRLRELIDDGNWPRVKDAVLECAEEAGRCALALKPVLDPDATKVDDALFAAAVWAVKKYQETKPGKLSVICSTLVR